MAAIIIYQVTKEPVLSIGFVGGSVCSAILRFLISILILISFPFLSQKHSLMPEADYDDFVSALGNPQQQLLNSVPSAFPIYGNPVQGVGGVSPIREGNLVYYPGNAWPGLEALVRARKQKLASAEGDGTDGFKVLPAVPLPDGEGQDDDSGELSASAGCSRCRAKRVMMMMKKRRQRNMRRYLPRPRVNGQSNYPSSIYDKLRTIGKYQYKREHFS